MLLLLLAAGGIYLLLGDSSGVFVLAVVDNVIRFVDQVPTASLVGVGVILAIIYLIMQRMKGG